METEQILRLICSSEYDFLREDEHLKDRIVLLTLGGSYAYGTNIETSDVDIRGCALNAPSDILGMTNFEQVVNTATDTTVYSFNRLISLLVSCNPNTIEILGCKPEHYFVKTEIGKAMIDNRKMFLSQRAADSFGGYATQQLKRLENALARDRLSQGRQEEHMLHAMQSSMKSFRDRYGEFKNGAIRLYVADSKREELDSEIFADISLQRFPAREFSGILNELGNVLTSYGKLNRRNHKKDDAHLNKHAMHLIRLHLMCLDILEKEDIITYREKDIPFLLDIRGGAFMKEDGTYRQEFFDMVADYEKRLQYAKANTSLPPRPNMKRIQEFVMDVNRKSLT